MPAYFRAEDLHGKVITLTEELKRSAGALGLLRSRIEVLEGRRRPCVERCGARRSGGYWTSPRRSGREGSGKTPAAGSV